MVYPCAAVKNNIQMTMIIMLIKTLIHVLFWYLKNKKELILVVIHIFFFFLDKAMKLIKIWVPNI